MSVGRDLRRYHEMRAAPRSCALCTSLYDERCGRPRDCATCRKASRAANPAPPQRLRRARGAIRRAAAAARSARFQTARHVMLVNDATRWRNGRAGYEARQDLSDGERRIDRAWASCMAHALSWLLS